MTNLLFLSIMFVLAAMSAFFAASSYAAIVNPVQNSNEEGKFMYKNANGHLVGSVPKQCLVHLCRVMGRYMFPNFAAEEGGG